MMVKFLGVEFFGQDADLFHNRGRNLLFKGQKFT